MESGREHDGLGGAGQVVVGRAVGLVGQSVETGYVGDSHGSQSRPSFSGPKFTDSVHSSLSMSEHSS